MPPRKTPTAPESQFEPKPDEIEAAPAETQPAAVEPEAAPIEAEAVTTQEAVTEAVEEGVEAVAEAAPIEDLARPADQAIDAVTATQQDTLEAIETAGATMIENVTRAQRAIADFVSTRIREDIETQQRLLRCKNFDEIRSVQTKFFKTAVEQYKSETVRLLKLGAATVTKPHDAA